MEIRGAINRYLLGKSVKEIEINRILDKISKGKKLSDRETNFLELYNITSNELCMDFMFLSKNLACDKIDILLKNGKNVICDLSDRNGRFGLKITDLSNSHIEEESIVYMTSGEKASMRDNCLYNIIYDAKRNKYSLQLQDEYYEKIGIDK